MNNLSIKIKGDKLELKIGEESCLISVTDGYTDDVSLIIKTLKIKSDDLIIRRRSKIIQEHKEAKKNLSNDIKNINNMISFEMKNLKV